MSENRANLPPAPDAGADGERGGGPPSPDVAKNESCAPDLPGLLPAAQASSCPDMSPSPSAETPGLLSLPWEIITHIASYLPAECVINVLPKVCRALSNMGKDSAAFQLRARRLIGSRAGFPVGPKKGFDWPTACLEMEQLITCWTGQARLMAKQTREDEEERERAREQQRAGPNGEAAGDGPGPDGAEGAAVVVQDVAYFVDVAFEDGDDEFQPAADGDPLERLREELEERLQDNGGEVQEAERDRGGESEDDEQQDGALNHEEDLVDPGYQGNGGRVEIEQRQPLRSPSPPPALECITLPSGHIAQVNSVLLVGGEGAVCATGSRDWNVKLWDLHAEPGGMLLHTLGGQDHFSTHLGWVWCLASQGSLLASGGFDSTVRLWDLQACGAERGLIRAGAAVLCLSCQRDVLLAGTFDKRVNMYDTRAAEPLVKSHRFHGNAVMCLAADEQYIISGSKDCTVAVYDRRADKCLSKLRLSSYLMSMSYSDGEIWGGDNRGTLHSFSMQKGILKSLLQSDVGHTALVTGIHRSPGSLYTCSSDRTVKVHIPCAPPKTLCTLRHQAGVSGPDSPKPTFPKKLTKADWLIEYKTILTKYQLSVEAGILAVASGDICVEIWRPRK